MPLTDTAIRAAEPGAKARKLFDGAGLYLEVPPSGTKRWRLKYRHAGKEKRLSLGLYPEVSLKQARKRRDELKEILARGEDPSEVRKREKLLGDTSRANNFEVVFREWFEKFSPGWSDNYRKSLLRRMEIHALPALGKRPIAKITAPELLQVVRLTEGRGIAETRRRVLQNCGQVFRYAVATGRAERDPSGDLRGALPPVKVKHHASITDPKQIGGLLRAIDGYEGSPVVRAALRLAPLVFVRPGELRRAEWAEIDTEAAEWKIPAEKMKMERPHIVPLSVQALAVLGEAQLLTGHAQYVFPSIRTTARPMSENTINAALRRLGYEKTEMTGHGFRSMASTLLNEQGWNRDVIERQLAHVEGNSVRAAYNYAEHLDERRRMMQAWADYLDALRTRVDVVSIRRGA